MVEGIDIRGGGGGFSVKMDATSISRALDTFPEAFMMKARPEFSRAGILWERKVKGDFTGYTGTSGDSLQNRTGALRNTVAFRLAGTTIRDFELQLNVGGNRAPYARSQEYGAVVKAKKPGGFLKIPMPDSLTAAGVLKGEVLMRAGFKTDLGDTFIWRVNPRDKNSRAFIAVQTPEMGLRLLYRLVRSVTIPGPKTTNTPSRLGGVRSAREIVRETLLPRLAKAARRVFGPKKKPGGPASGGAS